MSQCFHHCAENWWGCYSKVNELLKFLLFFPSGISRLNQRQITAHLLYNHPPHATHIHQTLLHHPYPKTRKTPRPPSHIPPWRPRSIRHRLDQQTHLRRTQNSQHTPAVYYCLSRSQIHRWYHHRPTFNTRGYQLIRPLYPGCHQWLRGKMLRHNLPRTPMYHPHSKRLPPIEIRRMGSQMSLARHHTNRHNPRYRPRTYWMRCPTRRPQLLPNSQYLRLIQNSRLFPSTTTTAPWHAYNTSRCHHPYCLLLRRQHTLHCHP